VNLELSSEEKELLAELLDHAYRGLKEEINKTEGREYKAQLKTREEVMLGLLLRLNPSALTIT
jgi:hypothetical protein